MYEVPVTDQDLAHFRLREGLACEPLGVREILTERKVTPYDSFAIWMHHARPRLRFESLQVSAGSPGCLHASE